MNPSSSYPCGPGEMEMYAPQRVKYSNNLAPPQYMPEMASPAGRNTIFAPQQYSTNEPRQAGGNPVFAPQQCVTKSQPPNYNFASPQNLPPPPSQYQVAGGNNVFAPQYNVINTQIAPVTATIAPNIIVAAPVFKNYMVLSIMTMLFCCLPVGIAAVVFSCKTVEAHNNGETAKEARNSQVTFKLNMVAIGFGCGMWVVWIVLIVIF